MIHEIKPMESDAKETLMQRAERADDVIAVIVLELRRDGTRQLVTNTCTMEEKCLLKSFFDAYIMRWFHDSETVSDPLPTV